jgi:hypothetical protein
MKFSFISTLINVAFLVAFNFCASAQNSVYVFNSFGANNTYDANRGWAIAGTNGIPGVSEYSGLAEYFTPNVTGSLYQIQLATRSIFNSGSTAVDFYIAQDNGRGLPGSILESFSNTITPTGAIAGVVTLDSISDPLLQAGQKYWLCAEPASPNTGISWCFNLEGLTNYFANESSEWNWSSTSVGGAIDSVFSISVIPVPEPSGIVISFVGFALLGILNWRGREKI